MSVPVEPGSVRSPQTGAAPASFGQEQMWLHSQLVPESALYNEPVTIRKQGPLETATLKRALTEVVRRHEAWRTNFAMRDGELCQIVSREFPVDVREVDLRGMPLDEAERTSLNLATQDALLPFDLSDGPLFRCLLVHVGDDDHRLHLTLHHIIFDGSSIYNVLLPELKALYAAFERGDDSPLAPLHFQFRDYATEQRRSAKENPSVSKQLEFWRQQLRDLSLPQLPCDFPRPAVQSFQGAFEPIEFGATLTADLKHFARRSACSLFMLLEAGLAVLLQRYSFNGDISLGTVSSNRKSSDAEGLLGYFLNPLVLRTDLSGNPTFAEALRRVRNATLDALSNDDAPFTRIVNELHPSRDLSGNPLMRVLFTLEPPMPQSDGEWSVALSHSKVDTGLVKFDLILELDDAPEGISGRIKYSTDLFSRDTIRRMAGHLRTLLHAAAAAPDTHISDLEFLSSSERTTIANEWSGAQTPSPGASLAVHAMVSEWAHRRPDAVAIEIAGETVTYKDFDLRSTAIAEELMRRECRPGDLVGICLKPSSDQLASVLGVLKAGAAYIPLDPEYPAARLSAMTDDARPRFLIADANQPLGTGVKQIDPAKIAAVPSGEFRGTPTNLDSTAYVIYTSGSTGKPRGVAVTHRALANSTAARLDYYKSEGSRFLLLSSFSFDSSLAGIFGTLCSGGTLILPPANLRDALPQLSELVAQRSVSDMLCVPSVYRLLLDQARPGQLVSLRHVILAGEATNSDLVRRHFDEMPQTRLFNEYGPTEACVWTTVAEYDASTSFDPRQGSVSVGRPIAGARAYILDPKMKLVPAGVSGELYIGGDNLAAEYLNQPELTAARFVESPFGDGRLYKSGDLARFRPDGQIELQGRTDAQVKIRGFRVELEEIAAQLSQCAGVREAQVVQSEKSGALTAYVISETGFSSETALQHLRERLPEYMVPAGVVVVPAMPLLPNGKVDRKALEKLDRPDVVRESETPTKIERRILAIFERLLDVAAGPTDNFFALGGHSLLLARLILDIEQKFAVKLTWAQVFAAPTARQLATLVSAPATGKKIDSAIIPIQPRGTKSPLFWVRGGPLLLPLASALGNDQPVLGIDLPASEAALLPTPHTIEGIAAAMLSIVRRAQLRGPYNLAGLCVNGVIAYEMAAQLEAAGEQVNTLAVFDAQNPELYHDYASEGRGRTALNKIDFHVNKLLEAKPRAIPRMMRERFGRVGQRLNVMRWRLQRQLSLPVRPDSLEDLDRLIHPASYDYRPKQYSGKVLFFQSSDWPKGSYWDFSKGWKHLTDGLRVVRVNGGHESMFGEDKLSPIATALKAALGSSNRPVTKKTRPSRDAIA